MVERRVINNNRVEIPITEERPYGEPDSEHVVVIPLEGDLPEIPELDTMGGDKINNSLQLGHIFDYLSVEVEGQGNPMYSKTNNAVWVSERGEWLGFQQSWYQEDARRSGHESNSGPYKLREEMLPLILEAFGVDSLNPADVIDKSPEWLREHASSTPAS